MYRFFPLFAFAIAACTTATITDSSPRSAEGGAGGAGACAEAAPAGTPACGSGAACDADEDCAAFPGNYCAPASCADQGCLRGRCTLTKVQGQACTRDAECWSSACACAAADPAAPCACAPGTDGAMGPYPH